MLGKQDKIEGEKEWRRMPKPVRGAAHKPPRTGDDAGQRHATIAALAPGSPQQRWVMATRGAASLGRLTPQPGAGTRSGGAAIAATTSLFRRTLCPYDVVSLAVCQDGTPYGSDLAQRKPVRSLRKKGASWPTKSP